MFGRTATSVDWLPRVSIMGVVRIDATCLLLDSFEVDLSFCHGNEELHVGKRLQHAFRESSSEFASSCLCLFF